MRKIVILALAALAQVTVGAASAQIGGTPATAENYLNSAGTGAYNNASGFTTGQQATQLQGYQNYTSPNTPNPSVNTSPTQTPMVQGGLPYSQQGSLAPSSVDMTPWASGRFSYGFNTNPTLGQYMGVSQRQPSGALLPFVSTGSNDFNTCDLPWCYPDGVINPPSGALSLIDAVTNAQQLQSAMPSNAITPNTNPIQNSAQALQALQQQFGQ